VSPRFGSTRLTEFRKRCQPCPFGKGEPLQHHERVQVLCEKRVSPHRRSAIDGAARPATVPILRAFAFQLFREPRTEAFPGARQDSYYATIGATMALSAETKPTPSI
jgi:hypothetical protein